MTLHHRDDWLEVHQGDAREVLAGIPAESVHCVVTSPPYWGLRDYGQPGQLGLEPTPEEYVANMVAVMREVRRVLRADGTLWLNLGDSYARNSGKSPTVRHVDGRAKNFDPSKAGRPQASDYGAKPKDLVGIPWRVAFALQEDGWYLRSDIIWSKPNPMPESVTDRPTKAHEYLFLMSKSARYYFDADAVREPDSGQDHPRTIGLPQASLEPSNGLAGPHTGIRTAGIRTAEGRNGAGRNLRSVWTIATQPYPGAHFATFPPKLVEPCIKAGTSERGVCPECGAPWRRVVERLPGDTEATVRPKRTAGMHSRSSTLSLSGNGSREWAERGPRRLNGGWQPTCAHTAEPVPATVLDPFAGSGTTGMVAQSLSRRAVLIDLSLDYLGQLMERNRHMPLGLA